MKRALPLLVVLAAVVTGCYMPKPIEPDRPQPDVILPVPEPVKPDEIRPVDLVHELADLIPLRVKTVDDLLRLITIAKDGGDWPDEASALVDKALPGITKEKRVLTVEDARKLREVK